jgi:hypothetical protein
MGGPPLFRRRKFALVTRRRAVRGHASCGQPATGLCCACHGRLIRIEDFRPSRGAGCASSVGGCLLQPGISERARGGRLRRR